MQRSVSLSKLNENQITRENRLNALKVFFPLNFVKFTSKRPRKYFRVPRNTRRTVNANAPWRSYARTQAFEAAPNGKPNRNSYGTTVNYINITFAACVLYVTHVYSGGAGWSLSKQHGSYRRTNECFKDQPNRARCNLRTRIEIYTRGFSQNLFDLRRVGPGERRLRSEYARPPVPKTAVIRFRIVIVCSAAPGFLLLRHLHPLRLCAGRRSIGSYRPSARIKRTRISCGPLRSTTKIICHFQRNVYDALLLLWSWP